MVRENGNQFWQMYWVTESNGHDNLMCHLLLQKYTFLFKIKKIIIRENIIQNEITISYSEAIAGIHSKSVNSIQSIVSEFIHLKFDKYMNPSY